MPDEVVDAGRFSIVEWQDTDVLFLEVADEPGEMAVAWARLEDVLGSLTGRRFYGVFDLRGGWYRTCVEARESDSADKLELRVGRIDGGRYLRTRLRGEPPALYEAIPQAFERLMMAAHRDERRPSIEHYRRRDEVDVLMPVD